MIFSPTDTPVFNQNGGVVHENGITSTEQPDVQQHFDYPVAEEKGVSFENSITPTIAVTTCSAPETQPEGRGETPGVEGDEERLSVDGRAGGLTPDDSDVSSDLWPEGYHIFEIWSIDTVAV